MCSGKQRYPLISGVIHDMAIHDKDPSRVDLDPQPSKKKRLETVFSKKMNKKTQTNSVCTVYRAICRMVAMEPIYNHVIA